MKFLNNTFGFLAVFCAFSASFAVTARPGIVNTASVISASGRRMPSLNQMMTQNTSAQIVAQQSAATTTMDEVECVEAYTECLASEESCGLDFEECTTNVLFHAQMPDCTSTLMQCSQGAITKLFGAGAALTNLSNVASYNDDNEITRYTYPLVGSILDQKIEAARIENMYDDQTCVKRYTNCLKRDDVCGENFELCTSARNFKKQALNCDSHLSRCQMSGVRKMFGDKVQNKSMNKANGLIDGVDDLSSIGGSIAILIDDGADYVALNAVSSCYKKVDSCILAACNANPLRCIEGTSLAAIADAEGTVGTDAGQSDFKTMIKASENDSALTASHINRYLRSMCADSIGGFEACHITYMGGKPKKKDLADRDIIEEVFNLAHNDRKSILESKIQGRMQEFDTTAKDACRETIRTCAMRACGGGVGSACYNQVFGEAGAPQTINKGASYKDVKAACSAVANNDKNCIYAKTYHDNDNVAYEYSYSAESAFDTLFPDGLESEDDPIGVVAELNALLATSYNKAAIEAMRKECESAARGCVKSLCGSEYESCYRNRTDVFTDIGVDNSGDFGASMNKVGGVLDYSIVLGLCVDTVKNNEACNEHLAIEKQKLTSENDASVAQWGTAATVRQGWLDASLKGNQGQVQAVDADANKLCEDSGVSGPCNTYVEVADAGVKKGTKKVFLQTPKMVSIDTYTTETATNTLFRDLVYDLEKEAQAIYKAKLTELQNMCLAENHIGGIVGSNDMGSVYKWVKLKNVGSVGAKFKNSADSDSAYQFEGLTPNEFTESNDLYGSFCAVRVTLQSDDPIIRDALNGKLVLKANYRKDSGKWDFTSLLTGVGENALDTTKADNRRNNLQYTDVNFSGAASRYFAIGDAFTCAGWLTTEQIAAIAEQVEVRAREQAQDEQPRNLRAWMTVLGTVGLGTGGVFAGDAIQHGGDLNLGISTKGNKDKVEKLQKSCKEYVKDAKKNLEAGNAKSAQRNLETALKKVEAYNDLSSRKRGEEVTIGSVEDDVDGMKTSFSTGCYNDDLENQEKVRKDCTGEGMSWKTADAVAKKYYEDKTIADDVLGLCNEMEEHDENAASGGKGDPDVWGEHGGKILGGIIGAGAGAGLAYAITDAALNAQLDQAGNEAYNAFMETVGSKIHCYIGSQKVGSYGQTIETSMQ